MTEDNLKKELSAEEAKQAVEQLRKNFQSHGGDLIFKGLEGKNVKVVLVGTCGTCPAAQIDVEDNVRTYLTNVFQDPEITVSIINEVNPELLDIAKSILRKEKH